MTNEELNIEIAKACGWEKLREHIDEENDDMRPYWCHKDYDLGGLLPDFCNDLNAMHQIEVDACFDLRNEVYAKLLVQVVLGLDLWKEDNITLNWWSLKRLARATARQRAETWLATHQIQEAQRRAVRETNLLRN